MCGIVRWATSARDRSLNTPLPRFPHPEIVLCQMTCATKQRDMDQLSRRRWTTILAPSVSYSVQEGKHFFSTVSALFLKLIYYRASSVVHLLLLKFCQIVPWNICTRQRTITIGGRITVWLLRSFTSMASTESLHTKNHIFSFLVKSNLVKLESSHKVILPPTVIVVFNFRQSLTSFLDP